MATLVTVAKASQGRANNNAPEPDRRPVSQTERIVFFIFVSAIGLSILSFIAIIIATASGMNNPATYQGGIWPTVIVLLQFGPPLAIIMLVTLVVMNLVRRRRESKDAGK